LIELLLAQVMESCIKQNNAINIYEDYFGDVSTGSSVEPPCGKTINIFRQDFCDNSVFIDRLIKKSTACQNDRFDEIIR